MPIRFRIPLPGPFVWTPRRRRHQRVNLAESRRQLQAMRQAEIPLRESLKHNIRVEEYRKRQDLYLNAADKAFARAALADRNGRADDMRRWNRVAVKNMQSAQRWARKLQEVVDNASQG
jgi:hypothetical protein